MRRLSVLVVFVVSACAAQHAPRPSASVTSASTPSKPASPPPAPGPLDGARLIATGFLGLGQQTLCGALPSGIVRCLTPGIADVALPGIPRALVVAGRLCAADDEGVLCWEPGVAPKRMTQLHGRRDLVLTEANNLPVACVLGDDGQASCVRRDDVTSPLPFAIPAGTKLRSLSQTCAIAMDGRSFCRDKELAPYAQELGAWLEVRTAQYAVTRLGQPRWQTFAIGITPDHHVRAVGPGFFGELGDGKRGPARATEVSGLTAVDEVVATSTHACARSGGRVACWGEVPGVTGAAETVPSCNVDTAASLAAYRAGLASAKIQFDQCMKAPCPVGYTDCRLGCHPPGEESKTVPESSYVYVQTAAGCLEQPKPSTRAVHASPLFLPGVEDARQVVVSPGATCVLRESGAVWCVASGSSLRIEGGVPR